MTDVAALGIAMTAAAVASAVNAFAGGGMLIAFPVLVALGASPITANATSTVGLLFGSLGGVVGYRRNMAGTEALQRWLLGVSAAGGALGALLLSRTSDSTFQHVVPWLILMATVLFAVGPRWIRAHSEPQSRRTHHLGMGLIALQLVVGVYGGYFGAGAGFVVLAMLQWMGITDLHAMNGLKLVAGLGMNTAAIVVFILAGVVEWRFAVVMMVGAGVGGLVASRFAQRLETRYIRHVVIACGLVSAVWLFRR